MKQGQKKGWCPTLEKPMETGDGLLVRLHVRDHVLTAEHARAIADASERYGNAHLDLTSRGNLQIRGVTPEAYPTLRGIIETLGMHEQMRPPRSDAAPWPLGFNNGAFGLGLAFGRMEAHALRWLASASERFGNATITLTPWRAVYLSDVTNPATLTAEAEGFILQENDARRFIQACPGAPACHAAQGETRNLALAIASAFPDLSRSVHISGCTKGCACSRATDVAITAENGTYTLAFNAKADTPPQYAALTADTLLKQLEAAL